jgi:hypothetical protein
MLGHIPAQSPELGILLHEPLHVRHCFDSILAVAAPASEGGVFGLIVGDVGGDGGAEIAKVGEEVLGKEGVGRWGEDDILGCQLQV